MSLVRFIIWDIDSHQYVRPLEQGFWSSSWPHQKLTYLHKINAQKRIDKFNINGIVKKVIYEPGGIYDYDSPRIPYYDGFTVINSNGYYLLDSLKESYIAYPAFITDETAIDPSYHAILFKNLQELKTFIQVKKIALDATDLDYFKERTIIKGTDKELMSIKNQFDASNLKIVGLSFTVKT